MAIAFQIPGYLRAFTEGRGRVEFEASPATVGEALERLWTLHPGVRDRVVTEQGEVRPHVNVFVGKESIRFTGGLSTPLPEGAEVWIVPSVSGGRNRRDRPETRPEKRARIARARVDSAGPRRSRFAR